MSTVLDVAGSVVAAATASYYRVDPSTGRMQSYCQQFVGDFWSHVKGRPTPNSYASANAARADSVIFSKEWRDAAPGDIVYFLENHVGVYAGDGLMVSATGWGANAVRSLGKSVYVHRVDDYATHLTLAGFSHTNGARERITEFGTATAGGGTTPLATEEEDDMYAPKVIYRTEGTPEWSLVAPHLVGPTDAERGYLATSDPAKGLAWSRMYAKGSGGETARVGRDDYITMQAVARELHTQWLTALPTSGGTVAAVDMSPVVVAVQGVGTKVDTLSTHLGAKP